MLYKTNPTQKKTQSVIPLHRFQTEANDYKAVFVRIVVTFGEESEGNKWMRSKKSF